MLNNEIGLPCVSLHLHQQSETHRSVHERDIKQVYEAVKWSWSGSSYSGRCGSRWEG